MSFCPAGYTFTVSEPPVSTPRTAAIIGLVRELIHPGVCHNPTCTQYRYKRSVDHGQRCAGFVGINRCETFVQRPTQER